MKITCPKCNNAGDVPDSMAGKKAKCPQCQNRFIIGGFEIEENKDIQELKQDVQQIAAPVNAAWGCFKFVAVLVGILFLFILMSVISRTK